MKNTQLTKQPSMRTKFPATKRMFGITPDGEQERRVAVTIKPPNFRMAVFKITGIAPLVIHRFSKKIRDEMLAKQEEGKSASSKKKRDPQDTNLLFKQARYSSPKGWDGFHAGSIRNAMISACRLVNFKMTLAKLSVFVEEDDWDEEEPHIPIIRIYGKPQKLETICRVETGQPYVSIRAKYMPWYANVKIRWDADQFTLEDVTNLLSRVGLQVGICEGRPDSRNSPGQGWGLFQVQQA